MFFVTTPLAHRLQKLVLAKGGGTGWLIWVGANAAGNGPGSTLLLETTAPFDNVFPPVRATRVSPNVAKRWQPWLRCILDVSSLSRQ